MLLQSAYRQWLMCRYCCLQQSWYCSVNTFFSPVQADELDEAMRAAFDAASLDARGGGAQRSGLVLVASLLGKTPNLAGLARTCEVLG